jgi:thiosulfate/3-mercaptopyruvate sulfurtransferase
LAASLNCQLPVSKGDQNPWAAAESVEPARLAAELASADSGSKPTILYIGLKPLFEGAHITGATFHGTASTAQGLADLEKWAGTLPRATHLVIYCGCCPFGYCPNIRPAFVALHAMGFTHLRVLVMPNNFASDWVEKGYPIEKGS